MEIFTAVTLAALVGKVTSLLKYLTGGELRAALTQAVTWAAGVGTVWVAAQADVSDGLTIWGELTLGRFDMASIVLAGLALGSGISVAYDYKRAIDPSDSAAEPALGRRWPRLGR